MENVKGGPFSDSEGLSTPRNSSKALPSHPARGLHSPVLLSVGGSYSRPAVEHGARNCQHGGRGSSGDSVIQRRRCFHSSARGRRKALLSRRGRSVGLSFLLLSFIFVLVRRVVSNCGYLFSKGLTRGNRTVVEGSSPRLLASGAQDENFQAGTTPQDASPLPLPLSLVTCIEGMGAGYQSLTLRQTLLRGAENGADQLPSGDDPLGRSRAPATSRATGLAGDGTAEPRKRTTRHLENWSDFSTEGAPPPRE